MNRFFMFCLVLAIFAVNPAHAVCVNASKANVRSGPDTS